jgi:zinc protease
MLTAVRQQRSEPDEITEKRFYAAAYGEHPYAWPPEGTERSLKALTREQAADFHARYYVARNAGVAIVGVLTRSEAEALAETLLRGLPEGEEAPPLPEAPTMDGEHPVTVAFPSSQTHVRLGQPALRRDDPDYFPLSVGNHVLGGGGLVSRLNKAVREERGLSYSVYSYFVPMSRRGPFVMGLQTKNAQADEAITLLRENLKRFVNEGPTEEELNASKQNIIGGFPLRIDSNAEVVEYLAMIGFYRLPLDWLDTYTTQVAAVTREQIRDAFKRRIHPDRLVLVRVGEKGQ